MNLVKIGNEYVNPEQVVNVSYSRTMDGDKYVVSVYLIGGRVVKEVVMQRYGIKTVIERLTTTSTDIKACARKIKEYCTYGKCDNCIFHSNGRCFTQPEVEDNYYNEEPAPIFPIDWDLD